MSGLVDTDRVLAVARRMVGDAARWSVEDVGGILICGNGGSAEQANHFAAELVGGYERHERPAINCVSLACNPAILTALANDYSFEQVFARQVYAHRHASLLIVLTTSGRSANIIEAARAAARSGMGLIALTSTKAPQLVRDAFSAEFADTPDRDGLPAYCEIAVDEAKTSTIQEAHLELLHMLAEAAELAVVSSRESATAH